MYTHMYTHEHCGCTHVHTHMCTLVCCLSCLMHALHLWVVSFWHVYKSIKSINQHNQSNQSNRSKSTKQIKSDLPYFQWIKQTNIWHYICKGSSVARAKQQSHKTTMPQHVFPCLFLLSISLTSASVHVCVCVLHLHHIGSCMSFCCHTCTHQKLAMSAKAWCPKT